MKREPGQRALVVRLDAMRVKLDELQRLQREVEAELASFTPALLAKADELARSRTGDEKRATELAALLKFRLIHGKPQREAKHKELASETAG